MARPLKTTPKATPCAVSLYPHERDAFRALGGSAFLRQAIDLATRGLLMPCARLRVLGADVSGVSLVDTATGTTIGPYRTGDEFLVDLRAPLLPALPSPPRRKRA